MLTEQAAIMGRKRLVQPEEVLRTIRNWIVHNGMPPTLEELQEELGVGSKRTVARYLEELEEAGEIQRWSGARGIRMRRSPERGTQTTPVPLVGDVNAGALSLAEQYVEGYIRLPTGFVHPERATFFLIRVSGDSMDRAEVEGGRIEDSDLVLVRQQPITEPGDIVVALVDGETTIKRLEHGEGYFALKPDSSSPGHHPIVVEEDFQIQGVVIRVLKRGSQLFESLSEN